jgi:hypothetical protein
MFATNKTIVISLVIIFIIVFYLIQFEYNLKNYNEKFENNIKKLIEELTKKHINLKIEKSNKREFNIFHGELNISDQIKEKNTIKEYNPKYFEYDEKSPLRFFNSTSCNVDDILISIVIPVYKIKQSKLKTIFDSILNFKSFEMFLSIEIIVVDDGNDYLYRIIDLAKSYFKISNYNGKKIICNDNFYFSIQFVKKSNGGLGSARNFGITFAQGMWIFPINAGDMINSDFFSKVYQELLKKKVDFRNPGLYNLIMPQIAYISNVIFLSLQSFY